MKVPFSYLDRQFADVDAYLNELREFVKTGDFTLGKPLTEFETNFAKYCQMPHAIGVGTGTDSIIMPMRLCGIGPGDEVITTTFTFYATVGAIVATGAKPVLVDSDDGFMIAADQIEAAITPRTKAIVTVTFSGNVPEMDKIKAVADKHELMIFEDSCQSIGAQLNGKPMGSWGEAAAYSLHPLKNLNVWADGGVITTRSAELDRKLRLYRNHGLVNRDEIEFFGINCRLDTLQAVIANRLMKEVEFITATRIGNAANYDAAWKEISDCVQPPARRPGVKHVYHLYMVRVKDRDGLLKHLHQRGIEAKVHYPTPIHLQPAAAHLGYKPGSFPKAEADCKSIVTLPVHQHLTQEEIEFTIHSVLGFYGVRTRASAPTPITPQTHLELNHRQITRHGRYRDLDLGGVDKAVLLSLLRQMLRLRRMEEALLREYHPADEMRCPIHFCVGQEAVPSALSLLVRPEDYLFSHHRSHGYYFAKGAPLRELFAEVYGKQTGANGGKAGSQDISHSESRFYSGAILGGAISIAVGAAYGLQLQRSPGVSISGFGEGATDEGAFWEAMNHAGCRKLPVLFVCENNRYATYSDQLKRQAADNICERVSTFGVRTTRIFGNDVTAVYKTLCREIEAVRAGRGPGLVEAYTCRWNSHVGPEDDNVNQYRTAEEVEFWKQNCPIALLTEKLTAAGHIAPSAISAMETEIAGEIAANFEFAKESPFPGKPDWFASNWNDSTDLASRLLETRSESKFDHDQADARLNPY
jgi:dTDP-3-amino-2,3,6-trideoxy-4-keto-D-glucose/dTDP-3-amino-3,4,6-trideoxy-alpha-D-glucose/dTDP-2,6-dideoxy-D-kanosamine transaminase